MIKQTYPHPHAHRALLVASAGLAIASVIPASRLIGSVMLRSIAFLSSSAICADSWKKMDTYNRTLNICRIGIVALGIIGVASAKPALYVASLAAEVGLQAFEVGKALYDRDAERALTHFAVLTIDSLMLAAVVSGAWQVMVTAAAVNACAMLLFAYKALDKKDNNSFIDACVYLALAATSITSSVLAARIVTRPAYSGHYEVKNDRHKDMHIEGDRGEHIATLKPGESLSFDYRYKTHFHPDGLELLGHYGDYDCDRWSPTHVEYRNFVKPPLDPNLYPTLPIGGTIVVDRAQT